MPAFSLVFNKLQIEIPSRKLLLSVESSISLQSFCRVSQAMKTKQQLDLLCSGKSWVTRGIGCRIDFIFLANIRPEGRRAINQMIEEFACYVRDAPLWSEVSLHAELSFLERASGRDSYSNFSIILRHPLPDCTPGQSESSLPSQSPDVHVPAGIPCFQLRRVKIAMSFNFGIDCEIPPLLSSSTTALSSKGGIEKSGRLKPELEKLTNFQLPCKAATEDYQVIHAVSNYRSDSLSYIDQEMLGDESSLTSVDFASSTEITSSFDKLWPLSFSSPIDREKEIEVNSANRNMSPVLSDLNCAKDVAHLALCKLIGGRQNKNHAGTKVMLGRPTLTLSKIAPGLFSPGFSEAISQRSNFIPTISNALSISLLRNAQSPNLRRKLLSLASISDDSSDTDDEHPSRNADASSDSSEYSASRSLKKAIDGHLWTMMQNFLYHPPSTSRILPSQDLNKNTCEAMTTGFKETSSDVLGLVGGGNSELPSFTDCGSDFSSEDFEDLLADKGDFDKGEMIFDDDIGGKMTHDDFEDLLEGRTKYYGSGEGIRKHDIDFDMIADDGFVDRAKPEDIAASYPAGDCSSSENNISYIENEDMLI